MAGDPYCEPKESPVTGCLAPEGVEQARALHDKLLPVKIDRAFASPYGRAIETAERALDGRGVKLTILPGIQEWTPSPAARYATDTEASALRTRDADRWAEETWKTELGEGTFDVLARTTPAFLGALASEGWHARAGGFVPDAGTEDKTIAFFAHGGSLNALLSFLLNVRPFPIGSFAFDYCGVASVIFTERHGVFFPALEFK